MTTGNVGTAWVLGCHCRLTHRSRCRHRSCSIILLKVLVFVDEGVSPLDLTPLKHIGRHFFPSWHGYLLNVMKLLNRLLDLIIELIIDVSTVIISSLRDILERKAHFVAVNVSSHVDL